MNTYVDKTQENKKQTAAHAASKKQSGGESTFQFVDNRPEAIAQRKLQEIANNSPQAKQAAQLQAMVNSPSAHQKQLVQKQENNTGVPVYLEAEIQNLSKHSTPTQAQLPITTDLLNTPSPPIQRLVDQATAEHSANNQYFIAPANRRVLYSDTNAAAPLPTGLYARGNDMLNNLLQTPLHSWTPNVRLFSNAEAGTASTRRTRQVPSDSFCGLAGLLGFTKNTPDHTLEDTLIGNLRGQITGMNNAPTRGVIGKNDCYEFANYLHHAIGAEIAPDATPRALQETRLGDRMGHTLTDPDDCPYHYATIVATDAASKVTLEANAGFDLTAPEFFIRDGIAGFMNANNATYDNGQIHTITGVETNLQNSHQANLQQSHLLQNDEQPGTYTTTGNGGGGRSITATIAEL